MPVHTWCWHSDRVLPGMLTTYLHNPIPLSPSLTVYIMYLTILQEDLLGDTYICKNIVVS